MANDNSNKRKLYDALSKDYDMGTYEQFCADLNDEKKRRKLFDATSQEYDLGTYDSFNSQLGYYQHAVEPAKSPTAQPTATATPKEETPKTQTAAQPKRQQYFKLRRGGQDFTVSTDEVNAAGGLSGWAKAHPGAPIRTYMQGEGFDGHVDLSQAHNRRKTKGYKYTLVDKPIEQKAQEPWKPTEQEKIRMSAQIEQIRRRGEESMRRTQQQIADFQEYQQKSRGRFGQSVESTPTFNPETGKLEKTYLTPTGERVKSKAVADAAAYSFRRAYEAADMSVGAQIRRGEAELADLKKQLEGSTSRVHKEWAEDYEKNKAPLAAVLASQTYVPRQQSDKENAALRAAIRQKEEMLKDLYEERDRQMGKDVGFWRGFGRVAGDVRTWDFGIGDFTDAMTMMNHQQYTSPNATEGEKRAGQAMMKAAYDRQQVEQMYGGNASFWNRAGVMTGYMPSFMVDFALTGGGYEVIDVAGKAATRGAAKVFTKEALKEMSELGLKAYVKKYGAKGAAQYAGNWTIKALGTTADELLIRAPLMTNTVQGLDTAADIIDRKLGNVVIDANGNYNYANDKTWGSAVWQAEANSIIENFSEMFGTHLDGALPALINAFGGKRISGMLARANASSYGQILATTRKQFERLGVSDYFGEVAEEYYGQLWRTMLNLDDAYTQVPVFDKDGNPVLDAEGNQVYERKNLLATGQFHGDIWGGMALSMGLMGAGKYTISAAAYGAMKHDVNKADSRASSILTAERWEPMRTIIDNTSNDDMGALAEQVVNDQNMTDEERAAVMEYMERSMNLRGYNLGQMAQSRGADDVEAPDPMEDFNQSWLDGYNARSPQEMADAQNQYEYQLSQLQYMLEADQIEALDTNPVNELQAMLQSGLYDDSVVDAARDYVNAKFVRDGIMQAVADNTDELVEASNATIRARINNTSGMIQPATMKADDRPVYIVGGNIVANPDGTIDHQASDESVVIRDAATGAIEFTDPRSIFKLDEAVDPQAEMDETERAIREQADRSLNDSLNGTLQFNPGDVYSFPTEDGTIEDWTLIGPALDENMVPIQGQYIMQTSDGQQYTYTAEDIQYFSDQANIARLSQFEQERARARAEADVTDQEESRPRYALNDEFTLRIPDTGQVVRGSVTAEENEDRLVEIYTEDAVGGNKVHMYTPEQLDAMVETYNGQTWAGPAADESVPNSEESVPKTPQNGSIFEETEQNGTDTAHETPESVQQSALERVPVDANGNRGKEQFEQTNDPDTAWDAHVELAEGDEEIVADVINDYKAEAEADLKAAEKTLKETQEAKPAKRKAGDPLPTAEERIAIKKAAKENLAQAQAIRDAAKQKVDFWNKVAQTKQRRAQAEMNARAEEERRKAQERAAEIAAEKAAKEEADRIEREALNGVPDFSQDRPADARARGYVRFGPQKIDRQEPTPDNHPGLGAQVNPYFGSGTNQVRAKGRIYIGEVEELQPSHIDGQINPRHFAPERQPKQRHLDNGVSRLTAEKNAENFDAALITRTEEAYAGAPVVDQHREGIQGNGRIQTLLYLWQRHPEKGEQYKQFLIDHAEEYGVSPDYIASLKHPAMAMMLNVPEDEAIRLGQMTAQDNESGGTERIKAKNAVQKMGEQIKSFANILLRSEDDEATFPQLVAANGRAVLDWMRRNNFISDTQHQSAFSTKGTLSNDAQEDLKEILYQSIFTGATPRLAEMFDQLPAKAQKAILATAFRDYDSPLKDRMLQELQNSIIAYSMLSYYEPFGTAKNLEECRMAVESWKHQYALDDVSGESILPAENFSNFALLLAAYYKGETQKNIQGIFNGMFDVVQGKEQEDLFYRPDNTPKSLAQAIEKVLGLEYQPITKKENGNNGSPSMDVNSEESEDGRPGSAGETASGEQSSEEAEPADNRAGTESDSGQGELGATVANPVAAEYYLEGEQMQSADYFLNALGGLFPNAAKAINALRNSLRIEGSVEDFAADGQRYASVMGQVEQAINEAYPNSDQEELKDILLFIFEHPKGAPSYKAGQNLSRRIEALNNAQEKAGNKAGENIPEKGNKPTKNIPADVEASRVEVTDEEWESGEGKYKTHNRILYIDKKHRVIQVDEPDAKGNYTGSYFMFEDNRYASLPEVVEAIDRKAVAPTVAEQVAAAEAEVNTNPTEAQKEAGNYKKGHLHIYGYDITIENPAGSVRSGVDADGNAWENTMHNTYGYIRGTEGVDGDHIDVYISRFPDDWDCKSVYIVDIFNPDGTFDEHKVMLGFNSILDAPADFLKNYSPEWAKTHRYEVSTVSVTDFERWINSSKRKTKPFGEYAVARKTQAKEGDTLLTVEQVEQLPWDKMSVFHTESGFSYKDAAISYVKGSHSPENKIAYDHALRVFNEQQNQPDTTKPISFNPKTKEWGNVPGKWYTGEADRFGVIKAFSAEDENRIGLYYVNGMAKAHVYIEDSNAETPAKMLEILEREGYDIDYPGETLPFVEFDSYAEAEEFAKHVAEVEATVEQNRQEAKKKKEAPKDEKPLDNLHERLEKIEQAAYTEVLLQFEAELNKPGAIPNLRMFNRILADVKKKIKTIEKALPFVTSDAQLNMDYEALSKLEGRRKAVQKIIDDINAKINAANKAETEQTGYTIDTYTTKGGKEFVRVIFPRADKEVWKERLEVAKSMGGTSVPKGYGFKTKAEAEAFAKKVMGEQEEPLSLADVKGAQKRTDAEGLKKAMDDFYDNLIDEKAVEDMSYHEAAILHIVAVLNPALTDIKPKQAMADLKFALSHCSRAQLEDLLKGHGQYKIIADTINEEIKRRETFIEGKKFVDDGTATPEDFEAAARRGESFMIGDLADAIDRENQRKKKERTQSKKKAEPKEQEAPAETPAEKPKNEGQLGLVSDARMEELKARLRKKLGGQLNIGIDPEILAIGLELTAGYIDRGVKAFNDYAKSMIEDLGDVVRPYLKAFYNGARDLPEIQASPLAAEMTPYDEVSRFDVANFDKAHRDAMATAEQVTAEAEVEKQARTAKKKLNEQKKEAKADNDTEGFKAGDTVISKKDGKRHTILMVVHSGEITTLDGVSNLFATKPRIEKYIFADGTEAIPADVVSVEDYQAEKPMTPTQIKREYHKTNWVYNHPRAGQEEFIIHLRVDDEGNINMGTYRSGKIVDGKSGMSVAEFEAYRITADLVATDTTYPYIESDDRRIDRQETKRRKAEKASEGGLFANTDEAIQEFAEEDTPEKAPKKPASELSGDSAEVQEERDREQTFVDEVRIALVERVTDPNGKALTMAEVRNMAIAMGITDISATDLQELVERAVSMSARTIAERALSYGQLNQRDAFDRIVRLYEMQPNLTDRDSERVAKQQYSTPVPMGFLMNQFLLSNGFKGKSLLEPSAGNGALTIGIPQSQCHVNDIDVRRLANLRAMGFTNVTSQDGLMPFDEKVDMLATNPPFGTLPKRDYGLFTIDTLEGQMAINGLESLADDGRAAIIIGGSIGKWPTAYRENGSLEKLADRQFFGYLYSHFNVVDIIPIDGKKLYARNGTGYNVRMILIDGRRRDADGNVIREATKDNRAYPPVKEDARAEAVTTYEELYNRVQDDISRISQRMDDSLSGTERRAESDEEHRQADPRVADSARGEQRERPVATSERPGTSGSRLGTERAERTDTGKSGKSGSTRATDSRRDEHSGSADRAGVDGRTDTEGRRVSDDGGRRAPASDRVAERNTTDGTRQREQPSKPRIAPKPVKVELTDEKVESPHVSGNYSLMSRMPAAQAVEFEAALQRLEEKHGDVDQWLCDELGYADKEDLWKALAAEQVEGVAMAIDKMGDNRGFIIADQTGIGKGRQAASIIRYAIRQGRKPIFFTQKSGLFSDMYRDLCDIGSKELRPFIFGSADDANITSKDENGQSVTVYKRPTKKEQERVFAYIQEHGTLPDEYDYAVITYSQVQNGTVSYDFDEASGTFKKNPKKYEKRSTPPGDISGQMRRDVVAELAKDNFVILDEAHTAGGQSGIGGYMQSVIPTVKGITYLSATYAKRPENMPLYAIKTAISDSGVSAQELINAVAQGGVPLQEIMSRQLVKSGELARRERDFTGVTIDWIKTEEDVSARQRERFDVAAEIFADIMRFQELYVTPYIDALSKSLAKQGEMAEHKRGTKSMGVANEPFASKLYNLVQQLLFAIKVDAIADRAIANLEAGRKPVISFVNTMENYLKEAAAGNEDGMTSMPTFALSLRKALDGILRFTVKDEKNNETHSSINPDEFGATGRAMYDDIMDKISEITDDLPIAPLDAIRMKIEEAGYTVRELSGRAVELAKNDKGLYVVRNRAETDKKQAASDFNDGKVDVLLINKTGSTGISLHASERFADQRQRVMIAAQFQPDVNDEVQMRGRIDRTGQVLRGAYEYLLSSIPVEQRLQMMFKAKLKSLDANTTSSQKSSFNEMDVVDVLNKYGDQIVYDYLMEDMKLNFMLDNPLKIDPTKTADDQDQEEAKPGSAPEGFARKALGRLALLTIGEQERVMQEIADRYEKKINELNERGENDLEITYQDLKAKTLSRKVWVQGIDPGSGNAFADNVYVEQVEVNIIAKPMKFSELTGFAKTFLDEAGVSSWFEWREKKWGEIQDYFHGRTEEVTKRINERTQATIERRREKYIAEAKEARAKGKNSFTDEEIEQQAVEQIGPSELESAKAQIKRETDKLESQRSIIVGRLNVFQHMSPLIVPENLTDPDRLTLSSTIGTLVGFKFDKRFSLAGSTVTFATLDGRRTITLNLKEAKVAFDKIRQVSRMNSDILENFRMEDWDSQISSESREVRYMLTGNILRALVDAQKTEKAHGRLITYTTTSGDVATGILMPQKFTVTDLQTEKPISTMLAAVRAGNTVRSSDGEVEICPSDKTWRGRYELHVPRSKAKGGKYYVDDSKLLSMVDGHNFDIPRGSGSYAIAYFDDSTLPKLLDHLSRVHHKSVMSQSKLMDDAQQSTEGDTLFRIREDEPPTKTIEGVKLFDVDENGAPHALFIDRANPLEYGEDAPFYDAESTDLSTLEALDVNYSYLIDANNEVVDKRPTEVVRFTNKKGKPDSRFKGLPGKAAITEASEKGMRWYSKTLDADGQPQYHTVGINGSGSVSTYALRPGWHATDKPSARHIGAGKRGGEAVWRRPNQRWFKIRMAADVDYNPEVRERYAKAHPNMSREEIEEGLKGDMPEKIPANGYYNFRTNSNANPNQKWYISGSIQIIRPLTEAEVKQINQDAGIAEDLPYKDGYKTFEDVAERMGDGYGAYTDEEVSYYNDPWSKALGTKSIRTKKQQAAFAARERQRMLARIDDLCEKLHLDNVEVITDVSELKGHRKKAKGWYNRRTKKITIVLPNNVSTMDIEQTLLHEAVAHHGLRKLFGAQFEDFIWNVYNNADPEIRRKIVEISQKHGYDIPVATEEYLASLAEDTNFDEARSYAGWWTKIKRLFLDMLKTIGLKGWNATTLTDNELRYLLWRSYKNLTDGPGGGGGLTAMAEDVVKQGELKVGEFSSTDDGDLYRDGDFSPRDRAIARDHYNRVVASGGYQFKEAVQDSMLGLRKLYEAILGKKGKRIEEVPGFENAYLYENRMSSANAGEQHEYFEQYMKPLLAEIGNICGSNQRARRELTKYLMAKHGLERNAYMRQQAANNGEDTDRDFAGLMGLTKEPTWQLAETAAQDFVDTYEASYDTTALWEKINDATKATLEKVYLSGILSKQKYEEIRDMYEYYVPLRGWDEKTSDEVYGYLTSNDGPLGGSIMKKAEGRSSMADDPIATIGMMADAGIRQGNRNMMKQRLLNFVLNNPSDLVSVRDLWLQYDEPTDTWEPVFADLDPTDSPEDVERKVEAFEANMETLRRQDPNKYKKGREAQHIPFKVVKGNLREHQILVKRAGQTFVLTINGNPRAAQAVNGLTNPDVETGGVVGNMLKLGTYINRQLSAFYTTRNPDFVVSNFVRDMLYSNAMSWVKESPKYAKRFHKNFGKYMLRMRGLLGKWEAGTLSRTGIEGMFYDFMRNGGETGYTSVKDIEGHKRTVAKELKKQGSAGRRAWAALGMQLDLLNRSAENCARFAAFVTSREMGRSIDRAIYDAKEVSVNFNKKGAGGKMVNAVGQKKLGKFGAYLGGGGRIAYVFWNAGIQGMTNALRQGKRHPAKFTVGASALFALGYVIPLLAQMLGGGDGDDDDKNAYYNLPEYVRRSNICFRAGGQWITIPLPIEYRAMYGMGELCCGTVTGNERYSDKELTRQMLAQFSQLLPLDMLEGGGGVSPLIPSALKPYTEAYIMNKGWTGLPVYKDTPFNKNAPEWTKAYASADQHLVGFTRWLNETTGGDQFTKGAIDINPAKIEYLLNGTFGGLFTFPNKIKKTGETMFGDREFDWRSIPIANRLIKTGDERTANRKLQNEYFKYKEEYEQTQSRLRNYESEADNGDDAMQDKADLLFNSPQGMRYQIFDEFKADLDAYREDIAAETDKEMRAQLEAEMYQLMRELVNALHDPETYINQSAQQ